MRDVVTIRLGGVEHQLLPTWGAYADIEARTGKPLRQLWVALQVASLELRHMAVIVCAGLRAANPNQNVSEDSAMRSLFESGPWWELDDDSIGLGILKYLEALAWTPEQRVKIEAERKKILEAERSANSSPTAPPPMA